MKTEPALLVSLDLGGTFTYAVNGGLTAVRAARLDIVGVVTLAMVSGLGGGIIRDILLGALPPATFSDWRYLAVAAAGGLAAFALSSQLARLATADHRARRRRPGLVRRHRASKALGLGLGAAPAVILGAVTGVGGGTLAMFSSGKSRRCSGAGSTPSRPCSPPRSQSQRSEQDLRAARRGRRRARVLPHPGARCPLRPERPNGPGTTASPRRSRRTKAEVPVAVPGASWSLRASWYFRWSSRCS